MGRGIQDQFPKGENDTSSTVGMACNLQKICWWSIYRHAAANGLMFFSISLLASILIGVGLSLRYKYNLDGEKIRPFECGFTPKFSARLPFSIRFFMVAIIFLVFDVELILIFPA